MDILTAVTERTPNRFNSVEDISRNCTENSVGCNNSTTLPSSTAALPTHTRPCGPEYELYCQNDARCEVITIGGIDHTKCVCYPGFMGSRCELWNYLAKKEGSSPLRPSTYVYIGLATAVALAVLITLAVLWYRRHKRRRSHSMLDETTSVDDSQKQDASERSRLVKQQSPHRWGTSNRGSTSDDIEAAPTDLEKGKR